MKNGKLTHIDLFSGIGGFALAADRVFGNVEHTFVEWEPFCQAVLRKHWPEATIKGDIRAFVANSKGEPGRAEIRDVQSAPDRPSRQSSQLGGTDTFILTGGFPCQPFSQAGRRQGTSDDRYLWPAMFEALTLFRPEWVIAENVAGLATWNEGLVLETVCADLESEGYEVQPFVVPACGVGAPHRRDRVWIVAHSESERGKWFTEQQTERQYARCHRESGAKGRDWEADWPEVAARLCTMDDGLPNGLVRPRGWRNAALKAAGNAIVPQVAERIMRAIAEQYIQAQFAGDEYGSPDEHHPASA